MITHDKFHLFIFKYNFIKWWNTYNGFYLFIHLFDYNLPLKAGENRGW